MENLKIKSVYQFNKNEIEYLSEKYNITKIIAVCFLDRTKFTLDEKGNVSISGEAAYGAFDKEQWKDVKRIVNGKKHIVGLKNDGTVVAYGDNSNGQCNVADWKNVVSVDIDNDNTIGFTKNHVMLETKKSEKKLPKVQVSTKEYTTKEEVLSSEVQVPTISNTLKKSVDIKLDKPVKKEKIKKKSNTSTLVVVWLSIIAIGLSVVFAIAKHISQKNFINQTNTENISCRLSENTLYIEGTGVMDNRLLFDDYNKNDVMSVIMSEGITEIGDYAFKEFRSLESITIPSSVTKIGESAFYWCSSLESITIPSSATEIDGYTFCGCSSLKSITIPNNVTIIESSAFYGCSSLKSITIPNSVTKIGYEAFRLCSSLENVTIPNSVTTIERSAFYGCTSLESITIPSSVTEIGDYAFNGCNKLTINGEKGSYAETYAKSENITFKSI